MIIDIVVQDDVIDLDLSMVTDIDMDLDFGQTVPERIRPPEYTGLTQVTPTAEEQILETKNKMLNDDITVYSAPVESLTVSQNGLYIPSEGKVGFNSVDVSVPLPSGGIEITQNGVYDVTDYETAEVTIPAQWTTDGFIALTEPSGDIVIDYATDIMAYLFYRRNSITSFKLTANEPCDIGQYAFAYATNLKEVFLRNIEGQGIGTYCFAYATELLSLTIQNAKDSSIGGYIVRNNKCKVVKINDKPASIGTNAFRNNTSITDLYVSWGQGEVADSPWSLRSQATIHYNTVFDENMNVISSD